MTPFLANVALSDTFDTWRTRTNQLIILSTEALSVAQSSFEHSNTSIQTAANLSTAILGSNAFYINIISQSANAVTNNYVAPIMYSLANNGVNASYAMVNNATNVHRTIVNAAFNTVNSYYQIANIAANTANFSYLVSNQAFTVANTSGNTANFSYLVSNQAFLVANTAGNTANFSYTVSNASFLASNTSGNTANFAYLVSNQAFLVSNTAGNTANFAYLVSNQAFLVSNTAGNAANQAFIVANNAANTANAFVANSSNTVAEIISSNTIIMDTIANTANLLIDFYLSNIDFQIYFDATNAAFDKLNASYTVLNAAYTTANSGIINIGVEEVSNQTFYPVFISESEGLMNHANIANSMLTYVPSTGTLSTINFNQLSDGEMKYNIEQIPNAIEVVKQLSGVGFNWKHSGIKSYGVVAQNIEKVIPELVGEINNSKTVNYDGIIAFLIEAVKNLVDRVEELEKKQ